jgi:hypothetical protein
MTRYTPQSHQTNWTTYPSIETNYNGQPHIYYLVQLARPVESVRLPVTYCRRRDEQIQLLVWTVGYSRGLPEPYS